VIQPFPDFSIALSEAGLSKTYPEVIDDVREWLFYKRPAISLIVVIIFPEG